MILTEEEVAKIISQLQYDLYEHTKMIHVLELLVTILCIGLFLFAVQVIWLWVHRYQTQRYINSVLDQIETHITLGANDADQYPHFRKATSRLP